MKTEKWFQLRKELYRNLETQVRQRLGRDSQDLIRYKQDYDAEFSRNWSHVESVDFLNTVSEARLVLMGDFHALQQSQKSQLRILKHLGAKKKKVVLALECFEHKDQELIHKFEMGKISEKDFLQQIRWQERWGFSFDSYRELIRYAIKMKWPLVGLNVFKSVRTRASLLQRDQFSANIILQTLKHYPEALVFVIYGDLHLAKNHLPQFLEKKEKLGAMMVRIFQNSEQLYFRQIKKDPLFSHDVMRRGVSDFCLLNVPPWVKWHNYLLYIEDTFDKDIDEDEIDLTDHVEGLVTLICADLGVTQARGGLSVVTVADRFFWKQIQKQYSLGQQKIIEKWIEEGVSFYLPEIAIGFLARSSVNHSAQLAMLYVHAQISQRKQIFFDFESDFEKLIWIYAFAYFGSKLVNPKRKTDTLVDLKIALDASPEEGVKAKESLRLALSQKMRELMVLSGRSGVVTSFKVKNKWSYWRAAIYLGGIMGERLFEGYKKKMISIDTINSFLQKDVGHEKFQASYYEALEVIESLPLSFKSKKEKL